MGYQPLVWDDELATRAQQQAQAVADSGQPLSLDSHSLGPKSDDGQNLYQGWGGNNFADASQMWLDEKSKYTPGQGFSEATGHYTQVRLQSIAG